MTTVSFAATHQGRVRDHNEDTFADTVIQTPGGAFHLLLVADGMGGHSRGEVASALATTAVREYLEYGEWHDPAEALRRAFGIANERVHAAGGDMGTTLVAALVQESSGQYWVRNVGDSRAYLLKAGAMTPLTKDHSEVAARVEAGQLSRQEAARVRGRNVLLRAIGPEAEIASDGFGPYALAPGERLLLCSDGLHGMMSEDRLAQLAWNAALPSAPAELIAAANAAGGRDNITVVVAGLASDGATVVEGAGLRPAAAGRSKVPPWVMGLAGGGVAAMVAALVIVFAGGGGATEASVPPTSAGVPIVVPSDSTAAQGPLGVSPTPQNTFPPTKPPTAPPANLSDPGNQGVAVPPAPKPTNTQTPIPPTLTPTPMPTATPVTPSPTATVAGSPVAESARAEYDQTTDKDVVTVKWSGPVPSDARIEIQSGAGKRSCTPLADPTQCSASFDPDTQGAKTVVLTSETLKTSTPLVVTFPGTGGGTGGTP